MLRCAYRAAGNSTASTCGDKLVTVQAVAFDWPKSVSGSGFAWSDRDGVMVSAGAFTASPSDVSGSLQNLRVLSIASVDSASAALSPLAPPAIDVKNAAARGIKVDVDPATIAQAPARLQAAANVLQAMGTTVLPLPAQWLATAHKLVVQLLAGAAILLLILKSLLTRAPASVVWRIAAILAPLAAFPLIALTNSWLAIVIAAPVLAIALWALAYRHAAEWQQRWEPAAIDVPTVLLGLLLLVLANWPAFTTPQIPAINQVTVARADVQDVAATVHQTTCGAQRGPRRGARSWGHRSPCGFERRRGPRFAAASRRHRPPRGFRRLARGPCLGARSRGHQPQCRLSTARL